MAAQRAGLTQALGMQEQPKASPKIDWMLTALLVLVFVAVAFDRGVVSAAWVTGSLLYMIALLTFSLLGVVAITTRTRLDKWNWLAALYVAIFICIALTFSFEPLVFITGLGLACGLVLGAYISILARRAHRQ